MHSVVRAALCVLIGTAYAAAQTPAPTPRWPDGRVRLGAPAGSIGYWAAPSMKTLVDATAKVTIGDNGLLANLADADRVAPFLPWSKAVFHYRQRTKFKDEPVNRCQPPGGPRQ